MQPPRPLAPDPGTPPSFRDLCSWWLEDARHRVRPSTLAHYESVARRLTARLGGLLAHELTPMVALRFVHERLAQGIAPNTANRDLMVLRAVFGWAVDMGVIQDNPLRNVRKLPPGEEQRSPARPFTEDELRRFFAAVAADDRTRRVPQLPLYVVLAETGARVGELVATTWAAVDLTDELLVIEARHAKTRKSRTLPLSPRASQAIRSLVPAHEALRGRAPLGADLVFLSVTGRKIDLRNQRTYFDDALHRAGLEKYDDQGRRLSSHSLRHQYATALARQGVSIGVAQKLLGHSTPALTERVYTHRSVEDLRAALRERLWQAEGRESPGSPLSRGPGTFWAPGDRERDGEPEHPDSEPVVVRHPAVRARVLLLTPEDMPPDQYRRLLAALARGVAVLLVGPDWRTE